MVKGIGDDESWTFGLTERLLVERGTTREPEGLYTREITQLCNSLKPFTSVIKRSEMSSFRSIFLQYYQQLTHPSFLQGLEKVIVLSPSLNRNDLIIE